MWKDQCNTSLQVLQWRRQSKTSPESAPEENGFYWVLKRYVFVICCLRTLTSCTDILLQAVCVWCLLSLTAGHKGKESQNMQKSAPYIAVSFSVKDLSPWIYVYMILLRSCRSLGNLTCSLLGSFYTTVCNPTLDMRNEMESSSLLKKKIAF